MWDSLAICETLAERHPEAGLWPDDAATRAPSPAPMPAKCIPAFPMCATSLSMDFARKLPLPELREAHKDPDRAHHRAWSERAGASARGDFLFGRFSIADCMYAPVVSRFDTYGVEVPPPVRPIWTG